jgi:hypothetical protein
MRLRRTLAVVRDAGPHPAWTERAPHIHIEARLHMEEPKPPDL